MPFPPLTRYVLTLATVFLTMGFFARGAEASFIMQAPRYLGLEQGLVGWWSFNGPTVVGTRTYDQSGQGNYGTLTGSNGLPVRTIGKMGQGIRFDGVDDYITVSDNNSLDATSNVTVSAWIKADDWIGQGAINTSTIVKKDLNYILRADSDSSFGGAGTQLKMYWWDGSNQVAIAVALPSTGAWHHIVGVVANNAVRGVYIDGVLQSGTSGTDVSTRDLTVNLSIGNHQTGSNETFHGTLDDVRIYNRALSADEIKRLYKIGGTVKLNTTLDGPQNGLVGWWTFDGKAMAGNRAFDMSGQGNYGTLTGSNGLPVRTAGKIGQGLQFDGVDDLVQISGIHLVTSNDWTVSAWVKPTSYTGGDASDKYIFLNADDTSGGGVSGFQLYMDIDNPGEPSVTAVVGTDSEETLIVPSPLSKTQWTHLVGVKNGTLLTLYVNNVPSNLVLSSATMDYTANDSETRIGITSQGGGSFPGLIDDVRIYNRALSKDEIKRLYNIGGTVKLNTSIPGPANGLVGWWTFDGKDMSGNRAYDMSGQGNYGTLTGSNGLPVRTIGKMGQGIRFDGVDDYVDAGDINAIDGASQFTVSAWVYQRSTDVKVAVAKWTEASHSLDLQSSDTNFGDGNDIQCQPNNGIGYTTGNIHQANRWEHWVCVFDGTQTGDSSRLKIYINGGTQPVTFSGTIAATTQSSSDSVHIGATSDLLDAFWNGIIDDVRIYNRALSADEIKRLYNMGR